MTRLCLAFVLVGGCGGPASAIRPMVMDEETQELSFVGADDPLLERQLAGHLTRVRGCYEEARETDADLSGLIETRFVIGTDGHVHDARVDNDTSGHPRLSECIRSRLAGLYFDPAPQSEIARAHAFVLCPPDADFCGLGPVTTPDGRPVAEAAPLGAVLHDHVRAMRECGQGAGAAVLSVEVTVQPDGRIMAGRVRDALPADTELRRCAIGPVLGAASTLRPAEPTQYRYTFRLNADSTASAARSSL